MTRVVSNTFSLTVRDPSVLPTWRQGMAQWEWVELTGTSAFSGELPSVDMTGYNSGGGSYAGRLNAYNGFAASGSVVYIAGMGGHADYPGNEAYKLDLNASAPGWVMLREPTPSTGVSPYWPIDVSYYADGRPSAAHLYYSLWVVGNELIRTDNGSQWGTGNSQDTECVAFDLTTNDWRAEGTYPDSPAGGYAWARCADQSDGTIYYAGSTHLHSRNPTTGVWTQLAAFSANGSSTYYRGSAVDTTRNRVVVFGDAYRVAQNGGLVYDITAGTMSQIDFTGTDAATVVAAAGHSAWYDATLDRFIVKTTTTNRVYLVHPTTWAITEQTTTGGSLITNPATGIFNKFVQVSDLGGIYYQPNHASNGWFLATE